jgi:hypothetical protein
MSPERLANDPDPSARRRESTNSESTLVFNPQTNVMTEEPSSSSEIEPLKKNSAVGACVTLLNILGHAPLPGIKVVTDAIITVIGKIQVAKLSGSSSVTN